MSWAGMQLGTQQQSSEPRRKCMPCIISSSELYCLPTAGAVRNQDHHHRRTPSKTDKQRVNGDHPRLRGSVL
eukprot:COSAG05_NODE_1181_length_5596_cov_3.093687_9_plen_72_part_00